MKRLILLLLVLAASVSAQVDLRGFGSPYWESSGDSVVMKAKWAYLDLDGQVIIVDSMHVITILADTLFSVYDTTQIALMDSIYGAGGDLIMDTDGNLAVTGWFTADSIDIDAGVLRVCTTRDSVYIGGYLVVLHYIDADSVDSDHLVVNANVSLPAGSLEASDIALTQNNILVGNGSGQAAAGTDLPTATTIGLAYVYRASGTDVADADVVDALTVTGGTVNNSVIGGVTPAAGTFTTLVAGRIQIDEIYHIYGGFEDSSATVAITQDQWSQVTNAWGTLFGGSESDGFAMANDTVVVTNAGNYEGMVSLTFNGTNSNEYVFRIYDATTDAQKGFKLGVTADGTTNHAHIAIPVYIEAAGNDSLVLQVTNTSGNNAATFEFGQFLLKYLHD